MPAVGIVAAAFYVAPAALTTAGWLVAGGLALGYDLKGAMPGAPPIPENNGSPTYRSDTIYNTCSEDIMAARCYGQCKIGGNKLRYNAPDSTDRRIILAHCMGEVEGAVSYEVNGVDWDDLSGSHTKTEYVGTRAQTANTRFLSRASAYRSMAYTAFTFDQNDQQVGNDPNITVVMQGLLCAPLAGGADTFTRNPAVILYDFLINVEGYAAGDLDNDAFQSLEELCDEVPAGGTLPRYRFDYNFDTDITINDAKKIIWQSFNGITIMSQGKIRPVWDSGQMADGAGSLTAKTVSHAFTEDNIVLGSLKRMKESSYNVVRIHYKDSGKDYKDSSVEIKDEYDISVNGEIPYSENCYFITDPEIARRRAKYKFNKFKYTDYKCTLDALSDAGDLEVFDLVTVTHTKPGWIAKQFIVARISENEQGQAHFELSAYYSGVYDDSETAAQPNYASNLPNPYEVPQVNSAVSITLASAETTHNYNPVQIEVSVPDNDPFYSYTEIYLSTNDSDYILAGTTSGEPFIYNGMGALYLLGDTVSVRTINVNELGVRTALPGAAEDSVVISANNRMGSFFVGNNDFWGGNASISNAATVIILGNLDGTPKIALGASADTLSLANYATYPGFFADGDGKVRFGGSSGVVVWDGTDFVVTAADGSNYVSISNDGIVGYDDVLGITFSIPTDGSAPYFASGEVRECEYQIYTSGVIKTDADPTANGGFLINNAHAVGYNSDPLKLFEVVYDGANEGDFYAGDYASGNQGIFYDHSEATLNFRGVIDVASTLPQTGTKNEINNGDFLDWSAGTSSAPDSWALNGAGAAVARSASAIIGSYCAALTRNGTNCSITQSFHQEKGVDYWKGKTITLSAWVWTDTANRGIIRLGDSVGVTYSEYHTGGSAWELLTVTHTVNSGATNVSVGMNCFNGDSTVLLDGTMCIEGEVVIPFNDRNIGGGSAYHTRLTSSGLGIFNSSNVQLANYGATVLIGQEAASQNNVLISSGAMYFRNNTTNIISITNAGVGAINLLAGSDINLTGDDSDPGKINFAGTSYTVSMGLNEDGDVFEIIPQTDDAVALYLGDGSIWTDKRFTNVIITTTSYSYMQSRYDATHLGSVFVGSTSASGYVRLDANNSSSRSLYFVNSAALLYFGPATAGQHKLIDLGIATQAWDDAYADDFNNVADIPFLDDRDDLLLLNGIRGSGVTDERTGLEIIDDDTLPDCVKAVSKDGNREILLDPDGKPYFTVKAMIGLLRGGLCQLDGKYEDHITQYHSGRT